MPEPTNREQRRAAERGQDEADAQAKRTQQKVTDANTPPDVTSTRAKSSRHGKSTADKWNQ
jgi:hypothetical protein